MPGERPPEAPSTSTASTGGGGGGGGANETTPSSEEKPIMPEPRPLPEVVTPTTTAALKKFNCREATQATSALLNCRRSILQDDGTCVKVADSDVEALKEKCKVPAFQGMTLSKYIFDGLRVCDTVGDPAPPNLLSLSPTNFEKIGTNVTTCLAVAGLGFDGNSTDLVVSISVDISTNGTMKPGAGTKPEGAPEGAMDDLKRTDVPGGAAADSTTPTTTAAAATKAGSTTTKAPAVGAKESSAVAAIASSSSLKTVIAAACTFLMM
ncbi:hypothetical protein RI054_12g63140 [Pseudoscourfieldia marina]